MSYFHIVIELFLPHITREEANQNLITEPTDLGGRASIRKKVMPFEVVEEALNQMCTVIRVHEFRHGFNACDGFACHYMAFTGFLSLQVLDKADAKKMVLLCGNGLRDQSESYYFADALWRMLQSMALQKEITLSNDVLEDPERAKERTNNLIKHLRSGYPLGASVIDGYSEDRRMDQILKDWDRLTIQETTNSPQQARGVPNVHITTQFVSIIRS
jgi:hypothetical protein